jgi:hypothetical protein
VLVTVAVIAYGGLRLLRPDYYPGENFFAGLRGEIERAFLHLDCDRGCAPAAVNDDGPPERAVEKKR